VPALAGIPQERNPLELAVRRAGEVPEELGAAHREDELPEQQMRP